MRTVTFLVGQNGELCSFMPAVIVFLVYMGCSDVSEFEHIYGQIVTTPSCVYTMHSLHKQE